MRQVIPFIILAICLTSCKGRTKNEGLTISKNQYDLNHLNLNDSNKFYFPISVFADSAVKNEADTFLVQWYSKMLFALREPIIFNDSSINEIYRFTWLRTFHNPIAIRIEKNGDNINLYWKLCNGAGGYEPGKLVLDKQKSIDIQIWNEFISRLSNINFWTLRTKELSFGVDGSKWILEGKSNKHYHVVDRWTPNANNSFYNCCDFLIGQTDLQLSGEQKY
jgi:hypothetical protein